MFNLFQFYFRDLVLDEKFYTGFTRFIKKEIPKGD